MAAIAAQRLGRPVKIAMARAQLFHNVYRRTDTHQRIRLAADENGRLTAIGHDSVVSQGPDGGFMEPVALGTIPLYAAPVRHFSHKVVTLDMVQAGAVRAPGEAVGMLALESAMDELAEQLGRDPVDFRKLNEPKTDPTTGQPFSTRQAGGVPRPGRRVVRLGAAQPDARIGARRRVVDRHGHGGGGAHQPAGRSRRRG